MEMLLTSTHHAIILNKHWYLRPLKLKLMLSARKVYKLLFYKYSVVKKVYNFQDKRMILTTCALTKV